MRQSLSTGIDARVLQCAGFWRSVKEDHGNFRAFLDFELLLEGVCQRGSLSPLAGVRA